MSPPLMSVEPSYRRINPFEQMGVQSQDLPPISDGAQHIFEKWGLNAEMISAVREFVASFRYDLPIEKMTEIQQRGGWLEEENGKCTVILPHFYDVMGKMYGQCGDIGRQVIIQAEFSGLLSDLNSQAKLKPGQKIVCSFCYGQSETHFCLPSHTHVWNSFSLLGKSGRVLDRVLVDAAFQLIAQPKETAYKEKAIIHDCSSTTNASAHAEIEVGWLELGINWRGVFTEIAILGLSSDRRYAYGVSFVELVPPGTGKNVDPLHARLTMFLIRIKADGSKDYFFIDPTDNQLTFSNLAIDLTQEERAEITSLLRIGQQIQIAPDSQGQPAYKGHTTQWD